MDYTDGYNPIDFVSDDLAYIDGIDDQPPPIDFMNDDWLYDDSVNSDQTMDESLDDTGSMSLNRFIRRTKELLHVDQTAFICYVLMGEDTDGSKARIDPILNRISSRDSLDFMRDYDSLLGFSSEIRIKDSLAVYPVPKNEDTLSHTIHVRHQFHTADVSFIIFSLS